MERIIKFKAKTIIDGSWVYGDLLQHIDGTTLIGDNQGEFTDDGYGHLDYHNVYKVDPSTVCQFTGIYDKDNKEIFENDLVQDIQTKVVFLVVWNPVYACYSFLDEVRNDYAAKNFADYPSKNFLLIGSKFDRKEEK